MDVLVKIILSKLEPIKGKCLVILVLSKLYSELLLYM